MAKVMLSQDVLAICLIIADGDIEIGLEQIIQGVEKFQDRENCHFGIDFRCAFHMLLSLELGVKSFSDNFDQFKLADIMADMLSFDDVYCNDEGENWYKRPGYVHDQKDYDTSEDKQKRNIKKKMEIFLCHKDYAVYHQDNIKRFMKEINLTEERLYRLSIPC